MSNPWDTGIALCTEAKYIAWVRGALRKAQTRYPTLREYKESKRVLAPVLDESGNQKVYKSGKKKGKKVFRWECPCEHCGGVFPQAFVQVDHIVGAGATPTVVELQELILRLYCGTDNLQLLCKPCHDIKTHMDKTGLSREEAISDKKRIAFFKCKVPQLKIKLRKLGATDEDLRNNETRQAFYKKAIEEKKI